MRIALSILTLVISGCSLHSGLNIAPSQQFVLGDNPHRGFTARVLNDGDTPVRIQRGDESVVTLGPGETARLTVSDDQPAVFVNASETPAHLDVRVRGDVGLGMGYERLR